MATTTRQPSIKQITQRVIQLERKVAALEGGKLVVRKRWWWWLCFWRKR